MFDVHLLRTDPARGGLPPAGGLLALLEGFPPSDTWAACRELVWIVCICFCAFAAPVACQRAERVRTNPRPSRFTFTSLSLFGIISKFKVVVVYVLRGLASGERSV